VDIHESITLRTEVDVDPCWNKSVNQQGEETNYLDTEFFMETELYWANVSATESDKKIMERLNTTQFECVKKKTYRITGLLTGLVEYLPVVYTEEFYCIANCCLSATTIGS
jgi:hypothetical protein